MRRRLRSRSRKRSDSGATLLTMPDDDQMAVLKWLKEWEMEQKEKEEESQAELGNSSEDDLISEFERDHMHDFVLPSCGGRPQFF